MCVYDFDYYVDPTPNAQWSAEYGPSCDCGRTPDPGEKVTVWVEMIDEDDDRLFGDVCSCCDGDGYLISGQRFGGVWVPPVWCPVCEGNGAVPVDPDTIDRLRGWLCSRCVAASRVLDVWCDGQYSYGGIPQQLADHWNDDELYRSQYLKKLVALGNGEWRNDDGPLVPLRTVFDLAADALAAVETASAS